MREARLARARRHRRLRRPAPPTDVEWCGARNGGTPDEAGARRRARRRPSGCASPRAPRRRRAAAGRRAAVGRASSCRSRAARRAAGCDRRRPPARALAARAPGHGRRRGRGHRRASRSRRQAARRRAGRARRAGTRPPRRDGGARPARRRRARPLAPTRPRRGDARGPARLAPSAAISAPGTGRRRPSRPSSPNAAWPSSAAMRHLVGRGQHRQGDREVEPGALPCAATPGARLIVMRLRGPLELRRRDARADAGLRLLAGTVGEADDRERRQPALDVRLDLDSARIEADERVRDGASEHVVTIGDESSRALCQLRADCVTARGLLSRAGRRDAARASARARCRRRRSRSAPRRCSPHPPRSSRRPSSSTRSAISSTISASRDPEERTHPRAPGRRALGRARGMRSWRRSGSPRGSRCRCRATGADVAEACDVGS